MPTSEGHPGGASAAPQEPTQSGIATVGRWALAAVLFVAGVGHFRNAETFLAQVPSWMPEPEIVVAVSGVAELLLALALVVVRRGREVVGWVVAGFFVAIFPGNIAQFIEGTDAFGLDSAAARAVRLLFQPVLVVWALWCTGAWSAWRGKRARIALETGADQDR